MRTQTSARLEWLPVAITLGSVLLLHSGALSRPFFADDYLFLEQGRGRGLITTLASPDPIGNYLRPVGRQLWFWLVSRIGGESPLVFHALGLLVFLVALIVYYQLAKRFAGASAAWFAMTFVALHYAGDVPLRWASGSQDLLAVLFGLLTILWTCSGRRVLAASALGLALLS